MEHQDWTPVILRNKKAISEAPKERVAKTQTSTATLTTTNKPAWKVEQQVDSEVGKPVNRVSSEVAKQIINGRLAMKLNQKQLAQKCNMQESYIKEIESCNAVENKSDLSKIKRVLGI